MPLLCSRYLAAAGAAALEQHMEKISKKIANMTEEEVKESMKHDTKKNLCFVFKKPRGQSERLKRIISEIVKARGYHDCTLAHKKCISNGNKFGTGYYANCRMKNRYLEGSSDNYLGG